MTKIVRLLTLVHLNIRVVDHDWTDLAGGDKVESSYYTIGYRMKSRRDMQVAILVFHAYDVPCIAIPTLPCPLILWEDPSEVHDIQDAL